VRRISIGDSATITIVAEDEIVKKIAEVSGDVNPIHLDDKYAQNSVFGRRIAHGLFCINGISRILGTILPGEGAILISQNFKYKGPVYIGDSISITVSVREIKLEKDIYIFDIVCLNQACQVVMEGESALKWKP